MWTRQDFVRDLKTYSAGEVVDFFLGLQICVQRALAGDRRECVFCGGQFARLLPYGANNDAILRWKIVGAGLREDGLCPACFSIDRERLVYLYLRDFTNVLTRSPQILHMAPERCLAKILQNAGRYVSSDLADRRVVLRSDVTALAFANTSFDLVICNHVLEHVPDDRTALLELFRVLAPGGTAILQVPLSRELQNTIEDPAVTSAQARLAAFGQRDHVRIYGLDYPGRLANAGFRPEEFDPLPHFGASAIERYGLIPGEILYVGRKV